MCALVIRDDISPEDLRRRARQESDGRVAARLIAIANALEGMDPRSSRNICTRRSFEPSFPPRPGRRSGHAAGCRVRQTSSGWIKERGKRAHGDAVMMMHAFLRAGVVMAWVWSSSIAFAQETRAFIVGNELLRACSGDSPGYCLGYVTGIADVLLTGNAVNGFRACIPKAEPNQLKDIVIQYLQQNPSRRHFGARGLVADAISEAFPCP